MLHSIELEEVCQVLPAMGEANRALGCVRCHCIGPTSHYWVVMIEKTYRTFY